MTINKIISSIAADRDEVDARLQQLANVTQHLSKDTPIPSRDAKSLLMSVVADQFGEAAARLDAISGGVRSASANSSAGKEAADEVIDVSEYKELRDDAS
jgi:hypothetical protein